MNCKTYLVVALALALAGACTDVPSPPAPAPPTARPSLLAGCYRLVWGGATYGSEAWPEGWESTFPAPERFAMAPIVDLDGLDHEPRILLSEHDTTRQAPRIDARLTEDADSLLFAVGRSTGVIFRIALEGDTLPGVAALWDGAGEYDPARYLRSVMSVRVDCATAEPVALKPGPGRLR